MRGQYFSNFECMQVLAWSDHQFLENPVMAFRLPDSAVKCALFTENYDLLGKLKSAHSHTRELPSLNCFEFLDN